MPSPVISWFILADLRSGLIKLINFVPGLVLLSLCCFVFLNVSAEFLFLLFFGFFSVCFCCCFSTSELVAPETRVALPVSYILQLRHIINLLRCWDVHGMFPGLRCFSFIGIFNVRTP